MSNGAGFSFQPLFLKGTEMAENYPKWLYHRTEQAVIVNNPDEQEALGKGWAEAPFTEPEAEEPKPKGKPVK